MPLWYQYLVIIIILTLKSRTIHKQCLDVLECVSNWYLLQQWPAAVKSLILLLLNSKRLQKTFICQTVCEYELFFMCYSLKNICTSVSAAEQEAKGKCSEEVAMTPVRLERLLYCFVNVHSQTTPYKHGFSSAKMFLYVQFVLIWLCLILKCYTN